MNKTGITYRLLILMVWIFAGGIMLFSQAPCDASYESEAKCQTEEIILYTDRDMFAVNERIMFRAIYSFNGSSGQQIRSKVLYVELVSPSGKPVAQGKFHIERDGSSGFLTIPSDILTGNYYLRTYTRWMRNFGTTGFSYVPLKIFNPFMEELQREPNGTAAEYPERAVLNPPGLLCQTDKEIYTPGEEVFLVVPSFENGQDITGDYCLSVIPVGMIDTMHSPVLKGIQNSNSDFGFKFLPDKYGVSISGSVVNAAEQTPAQKTRLHFSTLDGPHDYFATQTDMQGRFILTVPERTGVQELFVVSESSPGNPHEIMIDQDFTPGPLPFGTRPFALTQEERELATRMIFNMQLSKAFGSLENSPVHAVEADSMIRFYGMPEQTVILKDFVNLPTLEEVFINLVPGVFVHYKKSEPYFKVESINSSISLFPPLILLDRIPVFDLKSLLLINPQKIERIEVVKEVYVRGNMMYGGIIDIRSVNRDMAAIDLPEGSYFFDFQTFHPGDMQVPPSGPQTSGFPASQSNNANTRGRIPDARNTIKWIPRISPGTDGKIHTQFSAASSAGEYLILIRGVTLNGGIVHGMKRFRVEKK